jgi:hypothetical protein
MWIIDTEVQIRGLGPERSLKCTIRIIKDCSKISVWCISLLTPVWAYLFSCFFCVLECMRTFLPVAISATRRLLRLSQPWQFFQRGKWLFRRPCRWLTSRCRSRAMLRLRFLLKTTRGACLDVSPRHTSPCRRRRPAPPRRARTGTSRILDTPSSGEMNRPLILRSPSFGATNRAATCQINFCNTSGGLLLYLYTHIHKSDFN